VTRYRFNTKFGKWMSRGNWFHCHDEEDYCRTGDKVVIKQCRKLTTIKHYYVRNIVLPVGRHNIYEKDLSQYEKDAIKHNEELRARKPVMYF
jgi:hypothetical protein